MREARERERERERKEKELIFIKRLGTDDGQEISHGNDAG